jgi:hypothetical protein
MANKIAAFEQVDVISIHSGESLTGGRSHWAAECPEKNTTANKIAPFAQVDVVPH